MKIVCLGDSITWGFPWGPAYSWVSLAAKETGLELINKGVNGDTTDDLLGRFSRDVKSVCPSHVIIMAGTNDASIKMTLKKYAANCHALIEMAQSDRIIPALGLPIPTEDTYIENHLTEYRRWIIDYAEANAMAVLDFSKVLTDKKRNINPVYLADDVHPSREGYRQMAEAAVYFIKNWLKNVDFS